MRPDLSVDLCGVRLANPFVLGSGGLGESADALVPFRAAGVGAVCTRTLRTRIPADRERFPAPHLALDRRRGWLLNCEWGNLRPLDYWVEEGVPAVVSAGPAVVSVTGRSVEDCVPVLTALNGSLPHLVEVNFSCSHAGQLFGRIVDDPRHVASVVEAAVAATPVPVLAKLGWSPVLEPVAQAAEAAGAAGIVVTNSIGPGLDIDVGTGERRLGVQGGFGGVTGRAIFPIALECVHRVVESVAIPVVGVGGVSTVEDAVKMIMVGAVAVQVYTAALLLGPGVFDTLITGLDGFLADRGLVSVEDLRGAARPALTRPTVTASRVAVVDTTRCHPCGRCTQACPVDAISQASPATLPVIDVQTCTGCGLCVDVCPPRFDALTLAAPS